MMFERVCTPRLLTGPRLRRRVALGAACLSLAAAGGRQGATTIVLVNHQPFAIRMPIAIAGGEAASGSLVAADGTAVQATAAGLVLIGSVGPATSRTLMLLPQPRPPASIPRLVIESVAEGVRLSFDGRSIGDLTWGLATGAAQPSRDGDAGEGRSRTAVVTEPPDLAREFSALPMVFDRAGQGHVFDTWTARGSAHGLSLGLTLRAYHDGFLDLDTRLTTEPGARSSGVYAAVVTRLTHAAAPAGIRIAYDNRIAALGPTGRTPFRAGEGRHHFVQRGLDWATMPTGSGATVTWLNDFAESFTLFDDSPSNRFRQPRYTGANIPQLGSEAQATPEALFWITEIARANIASYRDRLIDNVLPPAGESVRFASRLAFDAAAVSDTRAAEQFIAYTGYSRQERRAETTEIAFGVSSVRFGTSYFPYSTLGENFDRLKLPGMDSEGYWPLAADTVNRWPLFADAIRRDLRIAKAMGFHVIRLHYLDVIARLDPRVQREYLDFLFGELRHLGLGAMLSPSDARFTPAQIAAMVARYRDVVESVELENEILIWGIPQDRPRYWNAVYDAVKAVAPRVPVHLTAHTNTGIFTRLSQLGVRFDRIGGHAYIDSLDAIPSGRGFALAMGNYAGKAGKPAVITEWNWRGLTRMTPEARARVYPAIIGGALESRAIGEFHQFQFQETLTVNPRLGRTGIRHYEPLRLSRRPKPEAFELIDLMRRFVGADDPIRRLESPPAVTMLDARGRATTTVTVTNRGSRSESLRATVEGPADLRGTLTSAATARLAPGGTAIFTVRLATDGTTPGFYHWFLRLQSADGSLRYVWNEARMTAQPPFDAKAQSAVRYPGGPQITIALDYTKPIRVVYGQNAPVLEMESAYVVASTLESASGRPVDIYQLDDLPELDDPGTLILVGTAASHALIARVAGSLPSAGSFVQRVDPPAGGGDAWLIVGGPDSRGVEESALDYVLRYWRTARDSAARRIGLVEKALPRTVDPAKLPDRIR
ncbi:MAG: hypothetical protein M3468_04780 [Acidobacteriota bacterium]|nr:hypothetical protein [Acidobacteriota bacterium]